MAGEDGQVVSVHTLDQWNQQFQRGKDSKKLVVVDFTASWCEPYRFIAPVLAEFVKKITNVIFLNVDVDELGSVANKWECGGNANFYLSERRQSSGQGCGCKER